MQLILFNIALIHNISDSIFTIFVIIIPDNTFMESFTEQTQFFIEKLAFKYLPVGVIMAHERPKDALFFKKTGQGCIASLIFSAAKGKTVCIDKGSTGYPCSAFYLGYNDWIFNGIEYFLSHSPVPIGRECERFVKSPTLAKVFVESYVPVEFTKASYVFKPLTGFNKEEKPEIIIFFANPDQISALVFLIQYSHPTDFNRIITGFASACMAMVTLPMQYARQNEEKTFLGLHDIAVRPSFPENLMTLSMPYSVYEEIISIADESFLITENWNKLLTRIQKQNN
jgi:uncharacterized protein (DUF169 family)